MDDDFWLTFALCAVSACNWGKMAGREIEDGWRFLRSFLGGWFGGYFEVISKQN